MSRAKALRVHATGSSGCGDSRIDYSGKRSGGIKQLVDNGRGDQRHEQTEAGSDRWRQGWMMTGSKSPGHPLHSRSLRREKNPSVLLGKVFPFTGRGLLLFFPFVPQALNGHSWCRVDIFSFSRKPSWVSRHLLLSPSCEASTVAQSEPIVFSSRHVQVIWRGEPGARGIVFGLK
jgi:hypothetical protein